MAEQALRDQNFVTSVLFEGSDGGTYRLKGDQITGRIYVDVAGGSGTVTSVSVVSANGFAGSVATPTTTPAITLTTTINSPVLAGNGTAISAATTTGSASTVVLQTSPTLITPVLGVATATSINGLTITTSTGTLTITNGKTLAVSNTLTFTGTDSSSVAFGTGGTVLYTASTIPLTVGTTTIASGTTTKVLYDNAGVLGEYTVSGSGNVAMTTSPVFTTPSLGVATATSLNGNTFTTGTYTLTGTAGKTLNFTNTLTLSGTDSTTMTFPSTTATIARTDAAQTFTGTQTYSNAVIYTNNAIAASANAATVPITARLNTVTNNSAATLTITMTTTSAVDGQLTIVRVLDFSAAAQTITWVNTENSTVTAPTTSNGSTTLPLTVGFQYNSATSKWRCVAKA